MSISTKATNLAIVSEIHDKSREFANSNGLSELIVPQVLSSYFLFVRNIVVNHSPKLFNSKLDIQISIKMYDAEVKKPHIIKTRCNGLRSAISIAISAFNRSRHDQLVVSIYEKSIGKHDVICFSLPRRKNKISNDNGVLLSIHADKQG